MSEIGQGYVFYSISFDSFITPIGIFGILRLQYKVAVTELLPLNADLSLYLHQLYNQLIDIDVITISASK